MPAGGRAPHSLECHVLAGCDADRHRHRSDRPQSRADRAGGVRHSGAARRGGAGTLGLLQVGRIGGYVASRDARGRGERLGSFFQARDQLRGLQVAIHARHQPSNRSDHRCGEAGAQVRVRLVGVSARRWPRGARVARGIEREETRTTRIHAVAAWSAERNLRPEAAETHLGADVAQPGDSGHTRAIGGRVNGAALVARGSDDQHALGDELVHDLLLSGRACAAAAEAQIDDLRRIGIIGHASHVQAGSPAHSVQDVGVEATALAQRAHRQNSALPGDARDARGVVRNGTENSNYPGAVPGAVGDGAAGELGFRQIGLSDPVTRIRGIGVAPIAVVGHHRVRDEVVAGQQAIERRGIQIRMVVANAGIDIGNDEVAATCRRVPGRLSVDRGGLGILQVPLTGEERIGGHRVRVASLVGHRVLDRRIGLEARQRRSDGLAWNRLHLHGMQTVRNLTRLPQGETQPSRQGLCQRDGLRLCLSIARCRLRLRTAARGRGR